MQQLNRKQITALLKVEMRYEYAIVPEAIRFDELSSLIDKQTEIVRRDLKYCIENQYIKIEGDILAHVKNEFFTKNSPLEYIDYRYVDYEENDVTAYQIQKIESLSDVIEQYEEAREAKKIIPESVLGFIMSITN